MSIMTAAFSHKREPIRRGIVGTLKINDFSSLYRQYRLPQDHRRRNNTSYHEVHYLFLPLSHCDTRCSRCHLRSTAHGPKGLSCSQDVRRRHGVLQWWTVLLLQLLRGRVLSLESLREVLVQSLSTSMGASVLVFPGGSVNRRTKGSLGRNSTEQVHT
ncbi:hypothetical protein QR685DRAFT_63845 [Neurospora intermedia]|uniref:Uncharacterized protein n=1 Tax=Neurospora intermedia TaxID=5142 RepID=A0ABR3DTA0_NEUIN